MKVQILHYRESDGDCTVSVWIDGKQVTTECEQQDIDPGRGYEHEDYVQRIHDSFNAACGKGSGSFEAHVHSTLVEVEGEFRKYSVGDWPSSESPHDYGDYSDVQ